VESEDLSKLTQPLWSVRPTRQKVRRMKPFVLVLMVTLLALPMAARAEQPMFRPLDGSTWDAAQVAAWFQKRGAERELLTPQERAQMAEPPAAKLVSAPTGPMVRPLDGTWDPEQVREWLKTGIPPTPH